MNRGFTLVELSIVLVIIGLIVSGVMMGTDMVRQAGISRTISQMNEYTAAHHAFVTKYGGIPGDLEKVNVFGLDTNSCSVVADAQGDGILHDRFSSSEVQLGGEIANHWIHLSNAKLVGDSFVRPGVAACTEAKTAGVSYPLTPMGGLIVLTSAGRQHYVLGIGQTRSTALGTAAGTTLSTNGDEVSPEDALSLDLKLDDGLPTTSIVNVVVNYILVNDGNNYNYGTFDIDGVDSSTNCIESAEYNVDNGDPLCTLSIRMQ